MKRMNMTPVTRRSFFAGALLVAVLAGCGGGTSEPVAVPAGTDLEVHAVPGLRWDQPSYSAPAGEIQVALVNEDTIHHMLVIIKDDTIIPGFELEVNRKGDVDSGTITLEPGSYTIFCTVPGHQTMKSTLTVE